MTDISNVGSGRIATGLGSSDSAGVDASKAPHPFAQIDSAAMLAEMSRILASNTGAAPSGSMAGAESIVNAAGAPAIDGVAISFSAEDMAAALQVLQSKTQEAQLKTAKEGLEVSKVKQQQQHEKSMAKIDEWIKKCKDAAAKQKALGIFGWIAKIAAFIAAALATVVTAVATVASGGAAAPLLALSVMGLVGATMSLASGISQAAGGPPLELSSLMGKLCTALLKACGVPEDKLEAASKILAGGVAMLMCPAAVVVDPQLFGNMFGGIAQLASDDPTKAAIVGAVFTALATIATMAVMVVASGGAAAPAAIGGIAKTVMAAAKTGSMVASAAGGVATATSGGLSIAKTIDEHAAATALVDKKKFDAMIAKLQQQMEEDREQIKHVLQQMQDGVAIVSQMIAAAGDSRAQISANLGKSMA